MVLGGTVTRDVKDMLEKGKKFLRSNLDEIRIVYQSDDTKRCTRRKDVLVNMNSVHSRNIKNPLEFGMISVPGANDVGTGSHG